MTTITQENPVVTLINVFTVAPEEQQQLVKILVEATDETMIGLPGFVSANIHRSLDGVRVVNYAQWRSAEDFAAMLKNPAAGEHMKPIMQIAQPDYHLYDVAYTHARDGATTIRAGAQVATFINSIATTPERQSQLLDFVINNDRGAFSTHPGHRATNFHRSRDGQRVVNYSQWESEAAFLDAIRKLLGQPDLDMAGANRAASAGAQGLGQTDFRFYEVVSVANAKEQGVTRTAGA